MGGAEDSMSDNLSDYSNHNGTEEPNIHNYNTRPSPKKWLLTQYRNLGGKVIPHLDTKHIRENGSYTLMGSTFRAVLMNLIRYAHNDLEKETNQKWFIDTFTLSRITKWNHFHWAQISVMNNFNSEREIFVEKLLNEILGEGWENNPISLQKRIELKSMFTSDNVEDETKEIIIESNFCQEQYSLEKELEFVSIYDIPVLSRQLFENVLLYRDIGLLDEYPKEVS